MATLRQSLNSVTTCVEAAEKWEATARALDQAGMLGTLGKTEATDAAAAARKIASGFERDAVKAFGQAAFEHGYPDV